MSNKAIKGRVRLKNLYTTPLPKEPKCDVQNILKKKVLQSITPESTQGVRQKAWRVRKHLPRDQTKRDAVIKEIIRIESSQNRVRRKLSYNTQHTSLTKEILQLSALKHKKKFNQIQTVVDGIKKKYRSLRNAHKFVHDLNWKRFHRICNPLKEFHHVRRISTKELNEVIEIYNDVSVTMEIPFKRHAKKRFMIISISEAYQKYIMKKKLSDGRILSMSSFYKLKPKNVKTKKMIPFNVCTCDTCTNYCLDRDALIANGIKGISRKSTEAACATMCPLKEGVGCDVQKYPRACIYRDCKECDVQNTVDVIKAKNPGYRWKDRIVSWHRWQSVKKEVNGKECSAFERGRYSGTAEELLQLYAEDSHDMPLHLLNQEWQRKNYCENRRKLKKGEILMVIDFAKNYAHVSQNEPQSAHWDRRQTTMHPICVNFRCTEENCNEIVTLEMVCFTEDLKHDSFAVKTFEDAAEKYLRSVGIPVNVIFQWSDNCAHQYKSKYAFDILSTSVAPKMRNYYGEKHGKSAADGIIGRLKMKIDQEIRSGRVILDTTDDIYNYCMKTLKTQPTTGCQHYRRHYILIEDIPRPKRTAEPSRVIDTLKIHSVRSTGIPGRLIRY